MYITTGFSKQTTKTSNKLAESTCEGGMETEPRLRHKVWRRLAFIHSLEVISNQHSTQCFFRNPWPGTSICWSLKENIGCFDGL